MRGMKHSQHQQEVDLYLNGTVFHGIPVGHSRIVLLIY